MNERAGGKGVHGKGGGGSGNDKKAKKPVLSAFAEVWGVGETLLDGPEPWIWRCI